MGLLPDNFLEGPWEQELAPRLLAWYDHTQRSLPWREDFLRSRSPYPVLVSEIMLQQTVIEVVARAYPAFMALFPHIENLAQADADAVRAACRGLGYYSRFQRLHQTARMIVEEAAWPQTFDDWRRFPGIGDYTAAALASIAGGQPVMVVDGNVERVFCRLGDLRVPVNTPGLKREVGQFGQRLIDRRRPGDFNQAIMQLGQLTCRPQRPDCGQCPVSGACLAVQRGSQDQAPRPKPAPSWVDVNLRLLVDCGAKAVPKVVPRGAKAKFLAGIPGFKTYRQDDAGQWVLDGASEIMDFDESGKWQALGFFKHTITRHKIRVDVFADRLICGHPGGQRRRSGVEGVDGIEASDKEGAGLTASLDQKAYRLFLERVSQ